ncbi:arsenate reductase [Sinimarinibacterium sp. NLF-5-8]|uniref:arsenate reductase n=1 Tax=Sinimarinibacterium sp. NLF-5-8 TaxID=2698684 RepID=UPI00137C04BF|nr:arsenate reductase [Sinimarinibacterium sp. NLF-5-8]QHS11061.1 arsenate reductase [Sinimarinibacterium sp. NLF-5-8]
MSITLYGIKNCDTVKRARARLTAEGIDYTFHDFKSQGLTAARAQQWLDAVGGDVLINRRGTTWRKLDDTARAQAQTHAAELLAQNPSLVKRPVIEYPGGTQVGFAAQDEAAIVAALRR